MVIFPDSRNTFLYANCTTGQNNKCQYIGPHFKNLKLIGTIQYSPVQRCKLQICGMKTQEVFGNLPQIMTRIVPKNQHTKHSILLPKIYCKIGKTYSLVYLPIYMFLQYLKCVVLIFSLENCPQTLTLVSLHAHIIIPRSYRVTDHFHLRKFTSLGLSRRPIQMAVQNWVSTYVVIFLSGILGLC